MRYKKILVTGAVGFIGYHLSKLLVEQGYEVVGLDNINSYYDVNLKYARLAELGIPREKAEKWNAVIRSLSHSEFRFVRLNLEDRETLPELFKQENFDAVIHLAAQPGIRYSLENPEAYIDSNIVGFLNILECCRHYHIKHLVYASSSSVYGENEKVPFSEDDRVDHPISLYAATKKSNELMAHTYSHLYRLPTTGLRFFTVYGPWGRPDMAPMLFASAIMKGRPIKVFNHGEMSRDFTYVDDIVQGVLAVLQRPPGEQARRPFYQLFNIGKGAPVSLMGFIETLEKALGKQAQKNMMPMQPGDVPRTWANVQKLKEKTGYKPDTPVETGVADFVKWFKRYFDKECR